MVELIDLNQAKQESCRIMICQLDSSEYKWSIEKGLFILNNDERIEIKINEFLRLAKSNAVDLLVFPELSVPEKMVEKLQVWSKEQELVIVCGSHYYQLGETVISRCPIIIKGNVFFTEKISPSPIEKSPINGEGLSQGHKLFKIINSAVGNFAVLICADYLDEKVKKQLDLSTLDLLIVPAFQRDSALYYNRMNIDCENSESGIYILYSNFIDKQNADGNSAVFGIMDRIFLQKLKDAGYSDLVPEKKLVQFKKDVEFLVADIDLHQKRPFLNRSISTSPNFHLIKTNTRTKSKDLTFIQKIAHDDERYKKIDDFFVPPVEYKEILEILENKNIVFIIGDPGIGKTYTAAKLLKFYFESGYDPIWFSGLEKEDREIQSKVLSSFIPSDKQIVYFEDPFGRTTFERRDSLLQVFSPLFDRLSSLDCKIIVTSRKEIFERFSKESLLDNEVLHLKSELNVRNPSYDSRSLREIFDKLGTVICGWYDRVDFKELTYSYINKNKIATPLAVKDFVFVSRNSNSIEELYSHLNHRENDITRAFALEIMSTTAGAKLILYLIYFCGVKGKPFISDLFATTGEKMSQGNLQVNNYSFSSELRSQIGYRIEQLGTVKSVYKFSHPIYEEALSTLILSDSVCEMIAKIVITSLSSKDIKDAYKSISKLETKYPAVSLLLFQHMFEIGAHTDDKSLKLLLTQKLISTFYKIRNKEFFDLACYFYPLKQLVDDINATFSGWTDLIQKLNLCQRYIYNSPHSFDHSYVDHLDWERIFNASSSDFQANKMLNLLLTCVSINPESIPIFIDKKGTSTIKKAYVLLQDSEKKKLEDLLLNHPIYLEIESIKRSLQDNIRERKSKKSLLRRVIFSEYKYYGKLIIDKGAENALRKFWVNLLPVGIVNVDGSFPAGAIVALCNLDGHLIGVGIAEYSSEDIKIIKGIQSSQLHELIGYFHTSNVIRCELLLRFTKSQYAKEWKYIQYSISL